MFFAVPPPRNELHALPHPHSPHTHPASDGWATQLAIALPRSRSNAPVTTRLQWLIQQAARQLWFRATAFSALAVVTALLGVLAKHYIPADLPAKIGADAVDNLLNILAASMLSVTIFSLSTLVSANASAAGNTTPRAARLLSENSKAQNALATFIGSFLFSLVGIIALQTGLYGDQGRVVLYVVTLLVIALIVATLLGWIDHVTKLGRVGETTDRVEDKAARSMRKRHQHPFLGGEPLAAGGTWPSDAVAIQSDCFGYVQRIDMEALCELTADHQARIFIATLPGGYADSSRPLAWWAGAPPSDNSAAALRKAFVVDDVRSFEQDPRFGLTVMSEIASRALSRAVNDPGTAIDVLGRAVRLLAIWAEPLAAENREVRYPGIHVPPLELDDLFDDIFTPIARDGAAIVEVGIRLQKMLRTLAGLDDPRYRAAACRHSALALARAEAGLTLDDDLRKVRELADEVRRMGTTQQTHSP